MAESSVREDRVPETLYVAGIEAEARPQNFEGDLPLDPAAALTGGSALVAGTR